MPPEREEKVVAPEDPDLQSRARLDLTDEELNDIHRTARHSNALDGVTGLLLFDGSRFLQIIEDGEEAIDNLVERLRMDRRHSAFEIRDERFVERRSFADWAMELVRVSVDYQAAREEIAQILPAGVTARCASSSSGCRRRWRQPSCRGSIPAAAAGADSLPGSAA